MIVDPQNDFELLENAIATQLQAQTEFQNLKAPDGSAWQVICEDEGDVSYLFSQMISICGFSIVVQTPFGGQSEAKFGNIPGPVFDPLNCLVQVSEAVIFNREPSGTGIHAETGASIVRRSLHLWMSGLTGNNAPLTFIRVEKDRDIHPETGALVASRILTFYTRLIEESKTIQ